MFHMRTSCSTHRKTRLVQSGSVSVGKNVWTAKYWLLCSGVSRKTNQVYFRLAMCGCPDVVNISQMNILFSVWYAKIRGVKISQSLNGCQNCLKLTCHGHCWKPKFKTGWLVRFVFHFVASFKRYGSIYECKNPTNCTVLNGFWKHEKKEFKIGPKFPWLCSTHFAKFFCDNSRLETWAVAEII